MGITFFGINGSARRLQRRHIAGATVRSLWKNTHVSLIPRRRRRSSTGSGGATPPAAQPAEIDAAAEEGGEMRSPVARVNDAFWLPLKGRWKKRDHLAAFNGRWEAWPGGTMKRWPKNATSARVHAGFARTTPTSHGMARVIAPKRAIAAVRALPVGHATNAMRDISRQCRRDIGLSLIRTRAGRIEGFDPKRRETSPPVPESMPARGAGPTPPFLRARWSNRGQNDSREPRPAARTRWFGALRLGTSRDRRHGA
jgi:hypothetical protein